MELTSQAINEAEFSMARRGYDPDQVDEFLEKLAVAVDKQNEALAEARERASMAERRANEAERKLTERPERVVDVAQAEEAAEAEVSGRSAQLTAAAEAELETLQRTLLLAQKTADATIKDAEEEARRMIAKAQEDARAAEEDTRTRLLEEIAKLDADRAALQGDVEAFEGHLAGQRRNVEGTISDLQRLLSDPARLHAAEAPKPSAVEVDEPGSESDDEPTGAHAAPGVSFAEAAGAVAPPASVPADGDLAERGDDDSSGEPGGDSGGDDEAWARFVPEGDDVDSGPPTQPVLRLDDLDAASSPGEGDDAYLSELRKAMLDDRGAPDVAEAYADDSEARQRFGRRR